MPQIYLFFDQSAELPADNEYKMVRPVVGRSFAGAGN